MPHDRKLVFGAVALTTARSNRHDRAVVDEIRDELEYEIVSTEYLSAAPFTWIGLMLRYGLKNESEPHYQRIDKKDGELPLAIELDTHELRDATREELKELFLIATLKTLVHVGKKYDLPHEQFAERLRELQVARIARA